MVPSRLLESSLARRILEALPVTLLSALIAVSVFATGNHLMLDSRAAGLVVALILVAIRAPFLVVVVAACAAAAACTRSDRDTPVSLIETALAAGRRLRLRS